jgi:hypothetical protein
LIAAVEDAFIAQALSITLLDITGEESRIIIVRFEVYEDSHSSMRSFSKEDRDDY